MIYYKPILTVSFPLALKESRTYLGYTFNIYPYKMHTVGQENCDLSLMLQCVDCSKYMAHASSPGREGPRMIPCCLLTKLSRAELLYFSNVTSHWVCWRNRSTRHDYDLHCYFKVTKRNHASHKGRQDVY